LQGLFFLAKPPFQVFFSVFLPFFFRCFKAGSQLLSQLPQFLLRHRQAAAFADVMLGGYRVLHVSTAFGTITHYSFTAESKHKSTDISLRLTFIVSNWSAVMLGAVYSPLINTKLHRILRKADFQHVIGCGKRQ
jgi:hypothetical protein